ncbi:hypothetical protein OC846_006487 [Tilletia horrida]|uniref:Integrase core domain-containing protein n=1 Tax=Tilletia horrida TaxID=155126 RepID=A0AAN6GJE2_9BASI|nr:hypothetical protein OC846_006487 [Tilletia horrida]
MPKHKETVDRHQAARDTKTVGGAIDRCVNFKERRDPLISGKEPKSFATIGLESVSVWTFRGHMAHVRRTEAELAKERRLYAEARRLLVEARRLLPALGDGDDEDEEEEEDDDDQDDDNEAEDGDDDDVWHHAGRGHKRPRLLLAPNAAESHSGPSRPHTDRRNAKRKAARKAARNAPQPQPKPKPKAKGKGKGKASALKVVLRRKAHKFYPKIFDLTIEPLQKLESDLKLLKNTRRASVDTRPLRQSLEQEWYKTDSGQWKLFIPAQLLQDLTDQGFKDADCAILLACSLRTLQRRRQELNIRRYNDDQVSDEDLKKLLMDLRGMHSSEVGERGTVGAIRQTGLRVSRARLRRIIQEQDPLGAHSRWHPHLKRREYFVPFVNSLWHIDGHHKLIRWKIVIHGAIDGKSRLVTYLQAAGNNRAETVARLFVKAVNSRGWPSRLRGDHGGEIWIVGRIMEEKRGAWDAARRGLDIGIQDVEEEAAMRAAGFAMDRWDQYGDHGADGNDEAEPAGVSIQSISSNVPDIRNAEKTHHILATFLPRPAFPPPADFGLGAYLNVLRAIDELTRE